MGKILEEVKRQYNIETFCKQSGINKSRLYRIDKEPDKMKVYELASLCNELNLNPLSFIGFYFNDHTYNEIEELLEYEYRYNIVGLFTKNEQKYMADMLNGFSLETIISPKDSLKISIVDSDIYEKLSQKWDVNKDDLLKKIDSLSIYACYTLIKKIQCWWNDRNKDIDKILI